MVSNYLDHPNGTTRHLHFDVQVFTRDGWLWVNPYVTLISAYERLIRGRGREIGPEIAAAPAVAHALPEDVDPSRSAGGQRELAQRYAATTHQVRTNLLDARAIVIQVTFNTADTGYFRAHHSGENQHATGIGTCIGEIGFPSADRQTRPAFWRENDCWPRCRRDGYNDCSAS